MPQRPNSTAMEQQQQQGELSFWKLAYEYRGTVFDGLLTPEHRVRAVQGYDDVRDDDVIICTYPNAGNRWAYDIAVKVIHDGDLEKAAKCDIGEVAYEIEPPEEFSMQGLGGRKLGAPTLEKLSQLPSPRVIGTHLLFNMLPQKVQNGRAKMIYVYRDPRDMAVSAWHQLQAGQMMLSNSLVPWDLFFESYLQGRNPFGLWSQHFKSYQEAGNRREVLVIFYEEMKEDLRGSVSTIAKFLGKELSEAKIDIIAASCTFEAAKARNPSSSFIRKGVAGAWKSQFTVGQSECFDAHMDKETTDLELKMPYWPHSPIIVEKDHHSSPAYTYQGITFNENMSPFSRLKQVYNYEDVRPDDVIIWSVPRSGTHWTGDIATKIVFDGDIEKARNLNRDYFSYEIGNPLNLEKRVNRPIPESLKELSDVPSPRVILTHLPFRMLPRRVQQGEAKVIYVDRDLRDVAVSQFNFCLDAMGLSLTWEQFFEDWFLNGKFIAAPWWSTIKDFEDKKTKVNVLGMHYEEMKADLTGAVKRISDFLNKNLDEQTIKKIADSCSITEAKKIKPVSLFVRKGNSGSWKNVFTVHQLETLERKVAEKQLDLTYRA